MSFLEVGNMFRMRWRTARVLRGRQKLFSNEEKILLNKRVPDLEIATSDGLPAIHKAILSKKAAIINYLLRNSANPFIQDK
ncbi:Ankyrin repeat domain-containing protein chloroplastic, partial [Zea mays]